MFEKNTPKSGIAPSKKTLSKKKDAPEQHVSHESHPMEEKYPSRRVPVHAGSEGNVPPEATDPNFYFRWCADYEEGAKIQKYKGATYEFVLRDGEKIKRPGGIPLFLMKLPKDLREQDILAKQAKIIDINKKTQQSAAVNTKGAVPEYLPDGQESVTERDNL
jgi:hypothetical protein